MKNLTGKIKISNYITAVLSICLLVFQFTPFWHYGDESISINGYVWLEPQNTEIESWMTSSLGTPTDVNSVVGVTVLVLLLCTAGAFLSLWKSDNGIVALVSLAGSVSAVCGFLFKPVMRLGSTWVIQFIIADLIIVVSLVAFFLWLKKERGFTIEPENAGDVDISSRLEHIKSLAKANSDKSKTTENDTSFYKLIDYLNDDSPVCRSLAAEALGETSRDVAFTHISQRLTLETDEATKKAMRKALTSIRENMKH